MKGEKLQLGAYSFDILNQTLRSVSGSPVPLRTQSMRVLTELARANGEVVSRDALIEIVWRGMAVTDDSLAQCIKDIRVALSDKEHEIIKTFVGRGYSLVARPGSMETDLLPKIFVDRLRATGGTIEAEELTEAFFEELLIRLAPRVGATILTQEAFRSGARYIIGGRATVQNGIARVFVKVERGETGEEILAGTDEAADGDMWKFAGRVADRISALLRVHMIVNDGQDNANRDDAKLSVQELLDKAGWHMNRFHRKNWITAQMAL